MKFKDQQLIFQFTVKKNNCGNNKKYNKK
jgi:hypothetical protein